VNPSAVRQSEIAKRNLRKSDLIVGDETVLTEIDDPGHFARRAARRFGFNHANTIQWPKSKMPGFYGVLVNEDDVLAQGIDAGLLDTKHEWLSNYNALDLIMEHIR
jgi:hypothetical protein